MTVYELRQEKEVVISQSNAISFGDNAPIDGIYEKDGRVYLAPPEAL